MITVPPARLRAGGLIADRFAGECRAGMVLRPVIAAMTNGQPTAAAGDSLELSPSMNGTIQRSNARWSGRAATARAAAFGWPSWRRPRWKRGWCSARAATSRRPPAMKFTAGRSSPETQLGTTDSRGELTISAAARLETLVVKNGQQLLARLPLARLRRSLTACLVDDDGRLAAALRRRPHQSRGSTRRPPRNPRQILALRKDGKPYDLKNSSTTSAA